MLHRCRRLRIKDPRDDTPEAIPDEEAAERTANSMGDQILIVRIEFERGASVVEGRVVISATDVTSSLAWGSGSGSMRRLAFGTG